MKKRDIELAIEVEKRDCTPEEKDALIRALAERLRAIREEQTVSVSGV